MKTRIDEYNGTYVAFVGEGAQEQRKDFATLESAKAWVETVAPKKTVKPAKKTAKKKTK